MRTVGIIAEYDPFHKGHEYHIARAKEAAKADYAICVLGTSFSQRGAPSLFSTSSRTRAALKCGADMVLALPITFSMAEAERFALGGVGILNALHTDALAFGAENADLAALQAIADVLEAQPPEYQALLKAHLAKGCTHARAQGQTLEAMLPVSQALLNLPNNALAICYLRALRRLQSDIAPFAIARKGSYHGQNASGYASASEIRAAFFQNNMAFLKEALPKDAFDIFMAEWDAGRYCAPDALDQALLYRLSTMTHEQLSALPYVSEGLENRLQGALKAAMTREELLDTIKTKRYTRARLSRLLTAALLGFTRPLPALESVRLLGFRRQAAPLTQLLKHCELPVVAKNADHRQALSADAFAHALWCLGAKTKDDFFTTGPIIL